MRAKELVQHIIGAEGFVLEDITSHAEMNEIILTPWSLRYPLILPMPH